MKLQVGVKIALVNPKGEILLLRRSGNKYKGLDGQWDIVGGRIDAGTPLLENLKREIKEETGIKFRGEPKLIFAQDILVDDVKHVVRLTFKSRLARKPKVKLNEEHFQYKWFSKKELKRMNTRILDKFFKEVLTNKLV
jgi:8-oxo-dGTP pyrophosphatase MutT (NUDIX family)